ncbi:hypothetical protein [Deinococcus sp. S9]|uniref:hypothetical protein n=1 Tax=Deinococcus sp. S9 TaxID=2545754 RepID=UPI001055DD5F|nr:hypothetical protein [Deinococcus sp. S9]TDE87380.1 hypothetical protein E0686_02485 [Deinococcus sp. S9]
MSVGTTSPESARRSAKRYAQSENGKRHIHHKREIERLKRAGKLSPPEHCPGCGRKVRLDAHHTAGYGKNDGSARKIIWRCRACHSRVDNKRHGKAMSKARAKAEKTKKREGTLHK